ncbi:Bug family tripartite tricarboxylate transporter substrate binding protein [Comamonas sp. J-3]|uniref:Bug family tripartite tricarboxylate transporter substrate binding protein n=1 Tax=Comamonas trifloxystrobinivorans TaxID=3350256 RepID=UPI00372B8466
MQKILRQLRTSASAVCLALLAASSPALAQPQDWPTKPIRLVVPAPPGGISDNVARLVAEHLQANLGQPVIVDNKPGGSAVIAERAVMNAPADWHTMMIAPSSIWTDFPLTVKTPFDVQKTFSYVADVASMVHLLVANSSVPATSLQGVLDHAQQSKTPVNIANLSPGTRSDLLGELLSAKSGGKISTVPYKGSAPAMVDLLGNQVQLTFEVISNAAPQIKAGKIKALGVVSAKRSPLLPDVPSFAEQNMPDFVLPDASVGLFVLSSTPAALQKRLRQEMEKITATAHFQAQLKAQGLESPSPSSLQELQQKMQATVAQNQAIQAKLRATVQAAR